MLNFGQIVNEVARNVQILTTEKYALVQVPNFVQRTYKRVWDCELWPQTVGEYTATIAANSQTFTLPKSVATILRAYADNLRMPCRILDLAAFNDTVMPMSIDASILELAPFGIIATTQAPAVTALLNVASSDGADTAAVWLRGTDAAGEIISESVTLAGLAQVATTKTFTTVTAFTKSANTAGVVTLYDNNGTTKLATLGPVDTASQYKQYKANYAPPSASSLLCVVKRAFQPFLNNFDVAFCEMDNVLIQGATALAWTEHRQLELAQPAESRYAEALDQLRVRELGQDVSVLCVPSMRA